MHDEKKGGERDSTDERKRDNGELTDSGVPGTLVSEILCSVS